MRVRHSKLLALIGAGILAVTALVACGNGDAATAQPSAVESSAAESTVQRAAQQHLLRPPQICPAAFPW